MSPTVIRFRCHRCKKLHSVAVGRAGTIVVCPSCFGPLRVPDLSVTRGGGIPTAEAPEALPQAVEMPVVTAVEQLVPEPETVEHDRRIVWGVALGVVLSLIGTLGMVVGLSLLQATRGSGDRLAVAGPPAAPIVAQPQAPPDPPVLRPEPEPTASPTPAPTPIAADPPAPTPIAADPPAPTPIVAVPPAPPLAPVEPVKPPAFRRRQIRDQEELRKELAAMPELALNAATAESLLAQRGVMIAPPPTVRYQATRFGVVAIPPNPRTLDPSNRAVIGPLPQWHDANAAFALLREMQPELLFLPWRLGDDCQLAREPAETLQTLSKALRNVLFATTAAGGGPDPELLRPLLLGERLDDRRLIASRAKIANLQRVRASQQGKSEEHWVEPEAIPALLQLLMAERTPTRQVLVDVLEKIRGPAAVKALARLAVFDIAPEVREQAIEALRDRPVESYSPILIEGLRYPWPPAADHAAEALVALDDRDAIPSLIEQLDKPDPQGPRTASQYGQRLTVVPAVVKINHLKNCLLCHDVSRSASTDLVRGRVPSPGQPLPPPVQYYGDPLPGLFVRADATYLRQDFSATQPVADAAPWPTQQRFDYLVLDQPLPGPATNRTYRPRKLTRTGLEPVHSYPQRESVLFALRALTGKDPGTTSHAWRDAMQPARSIPANEPVGQ